MGKEYRAISQMLGAALVWSLSGVLSKLTPWHPFVISATRSIVGVIVLLLYMRLVKIPWTCNKKSIVLGTCIAIMFSLYLPAVKLTTAANAVVLHYTAPIYVLLLNALVYKKKIRIADALVVALAVLGMALCFLDRLGGGALLGNLLALGSGMFLGIMFFVSGNIGEEERLTGLVLGFSLGALVGIPFLFTTDVPVKPEYVLYTLLHGGVQLGLGYVLYTRAIRTCAPLMCSLIAVLEPLANPIWVYLFVGELPGAYAILGSVIVLASVTFWCVWNEKQKQKQAALAAGMVEKSNGV